MPKDRKTNTRNPKMPKLIVRSFLRMIPGMPGPELFDIFDELRKSRTSIDDKVAKATQSLHETSTLIQELEEELKGRTQKLEYLRDQVKRYSDLAEIEEAKARALLKEVQTVVNRGKGIERFISLLISLVAGVLIFLFGIMVGPKITSWLDKSDEVPQTTQPATTNLADTREDELRLEKSTQDRQN